MQQEETFTPMTQQMTIFESRTNSECDICMEDRVEYFSCGNDKCSASICGECIRHMNNHGMKLRVDTICCFCQLNIQCADYKNIIPQQIVIVYGIQGNDNTINPIPDRTYLLTISNNPSYNGNMKMVQDMSTTELTHIMRKMASDVIEREIIGRRGNRESIGDGSEVIGRQIRAETDDRQTTTDDRQTTTGADTDIEMGIVMQPIQPLPDIISDNDISNPTVMFTASKYNISAYTTPFFIKANETLTLENYRELFTKSKTMNTNSFKRLITNMPNYDTTIYSDCIIGNNHTMRMDVVNYIPSRLKLAFAMNQSIPFLMFILIVVGNEHTSTQSDPYKFFCFTIPFITIITSVLTGITYVTHSKRTFIMTGVEAYPTIEFKKRFLFCTTVLKKVTTVKLDQVLNKVACIRDIYLSNGKQATISCIFLTVAY